jgi:hypothetical protein
MPANPDSGSPYCLSSSIENIVTFPEETHLLEFLMKAP